MRPDPTSFSPPRPAPASAAALPGWLRPLGCAALAAAGAALAHPGTAISGVFAALAVAGCGLLAYVPGRRPTPGAAEQDTAQGARVMGREIVPVWRRHLAASRDEADRGVNGLLQHFASLSDGLNEAIAAAEGNTALRIAAVSGDDMMERHPQALAALLEPLQRMRDQRRATSELLRQVETRQEDLRRVAANVTRLARHIGLVAMNAAIEANRGGAAQSGFGSVAAEVRDVATGLQACSGALEPQMTELVDLLRTVRQREELADENDETLEIASRVRAREVVEILVGELGSALEQTRRLRETSQQLRDDLDGVFIGFQFQDRLNQMLGSLQDDMDRFEQWLREPGRRAGAEDAAEWLRRLEATYTMQEQHAFHHGHAEIRKAAAVEFF